MDRLVIASKAPFFFGTNGDRMAEARELTQ